MIFTPAATRSFATFWAATAGTAITPTMMFLSRTVGHVPVTPYESLAATVHEKNIIVGVMAVPAGAAQKVANDLVGAGVKIIFNYSEALLETPADVTVHTSNPAVELLYALYFHLT